MTDRTVTDPSQQTVEHRHAVTIRRHRAPSVRERTLYGPVNQRPCPRCELRRESKAECIERHERWRLIRWAGSIVLATTGAVLIALAAVAWFTAWVVTL